MSFESPRSCGNLLGLGLMGLKNYFWVGTVRINKKTGSANYSVSSLKDLTNVIIPGGAFL